MDFDEISWILTNSREKCMISRLPINEEPGTVRGRVKKVRDVFVAKIYAEMCNFVQKMHCFGQFVFFL